MKQFWGSLNFMYKISAVVITLEAASVCLNKLREWIGRYTSVGKRYYNRLY